MEWNLIYGFNPVIPGVLKTNEIPGGAPGAPSMKMVKECFYDPNPKRLF